MAKIPLCLGKSNGCGSLVTRGSLLNLDARGVHKKDSVMGVVRDCIRLDEIVLNSLNQLLRLCLAPSRKRQVHQGHEVKGAHSEVCEKTSHPSRHEQLWAARTPLHSQHEGIYRTFGGCSLLKGPLAMTYSTTAQHIPNSWGADSDLDSTEGDQHIS